jgi:hypothetical protein
MRGLTLTVCVFLLFNGCTCLSSGASPSCEFGNLTFGDGGGGRGCEPEGGLFDEADATVVDEEPDAADAGDADAGEASAFGYCNGFLCPAGCACDVAPDAASGSQCVCPDAGELDAAPDATAPDAPADVTLDVTGPDASPDATPDATADGPIPSPDAGLPDADVDDAGSPTPCGVITCGAGCVCLSPAVSQCGCPVP